METYLEIGAVLILSHHESGRTPPVFRSKDRWTTGGPPPQEILVRQASSGHCARDSRGGPPQYSKFVQQRESV